MDITEELAIGNAEALLKENSISTLPIDPTYIAKKILDVEVQANPSKEKGVSGMLLRDGNSFGIVYATYIDNPGFQRFSVAHEIGHLVLPGHPDQFSTGPIAHQSHAGFKGYSDYETEADFFASGLLMPSHLVESILRKHQEGFQSIQAIKEACVTSLTASAIRYTKLTNSIAAIVVSKGNQINYCFMSDQLKELDGLQWISKNTPLPEDSLSKEFNSYPENVHSAERADSTSHIQDWFGGDYDFELIEEVVGLGRYGKTLTVLHTEEDPDDDEDELPGMDDIRFRGKYE